MAVMTPPLDQRNYQIGSDLEYDTALRLELQLPPTYQVFHSVYWSTSDEWSSMLGEIDFIVMAPSGRLLLIEQKNGWLLETDEGLKKMYQTQEKSIFAQISRNYGKLASAFHKTHAQKLDIDFLLYCPDYQVVNRSAAGIQANRIVDQNEVSELHTRILGILNQRDLAPAHCGNTLAIENFLLSRLGVRYDFTTVGNAAKTAYIPIAAGLNKWVGKLEGLPLKLLINATAGSGKTQLALEEIRAAKTANQTHLYVCFNRTLADDMKASTGSTENCVTFHELAKNIADQTNQTIELTAPGAFDRLTEVFLQSASLLSGIFDVIVIDEGQDFERTWLEALFPLIKSNGRLIVMQDRNQSLYNREPCEFDGFVRLNHQVSYRCPAEVIAIINGENLADHEIECQSPVEGLETIVETYNSDSDCESATEKITDCP